MSAFTMTRRRRSILERLHITDSFGLTMGGLMLCILAAVAVFVAVLMFAIVESSRSVGRTTCRNFQTQTGYETKFVLLNFFDTGTCLAKAPDGRWVLNSKVLTIAGKQP